MTLERRLARLEASQRTTPESSVSTWAEKREQGRRVCDAMKAGMTIEQAIEAAGCDPELAARLRHAEHIYDQFAKNCGRETP